MNDDGEIVTVETSAAMFRGADAEMEHVFYTKNGDLYDFSLASKSAHLVHPPVSGGAGVVQVLHVSENGNRVYFASTKDVLGEDNPVDPYGLWVAERKADGMSFQVEHVAEITAPVDTFLDDPSGQQWNVSLSVRSYGADPEGNVLAFRSATAIVPGRRTGGFAQVYAYERERDAVYCLSCPPDGSDPATDFPAGRGFYGNLQPTTNLAHIPSLATSNSGSLRAGGFWDATNPPPRVVADDGTVIFQAGYPLVAEDSNQDWDVYEWRGGEISLVSGGIGEWEAKLGSISRDAGTILFDSQVDLVPDLPESFVRRSYAARTGGGFPRPIPPDPACRGVECRQAAAGTAPDLPGRSTPEQHSSARQASDREQARSCRRIARRLKTSGRRAAVRRANGLRRLRARKASPRRLRAAKRRHRQVRARAKVLNRKLDICRRASR